MIPQDRDQPGPPGRVTIWGYPWHGLVEDGTLTLPNAATMPYPAPTAAGEADVLAFVVPGTPAVVRTPAQAAADAAAGRQWLDYALISGRYQRRLYGQVIGGNGTWIYVAPDGSRWRATIAGVPGVQDLTAPWATTLTLERFGEIGAPAESHALPVSLADWQQAIPGHPGGDYALDAFGDVSAANVEVEDVRRDGSAALLGVQIDVPNNAWGAGDDDPLARILLGTVELTLSGTPGVDADATLAVRHSRAQALGTVTETRIESYETWWFNIFGVPPSLFTWDQTFSDESDGMSAQVGSEEGAITRADRLLAAGYTAAGAIAEITIDAEFAYTGSAPMPPDGEATSRTVSASGDGTITLSGPGGSVQIALSFSSSLQQSFSHDGQGGYASQQVRNLQASAGPLSDTVGGTSVDTTPLFSWSGPESTTFGLGGEDDGAEPLNGGNMYFAEGALQNWFAGIRRYSATCLEMLLVTQDTTTGAYQAWHHLGAVAVASSAAATQTSPNMRPYGTAHPVTGAIERVRDVPVVWV